jgi:general secretion pathway protein F
VFLFLLGGVGRKVVPAFADSIVMKIPFYKDLVLSKNNYTTLYGLSLLIGSGVPMEQSLSLTAQSSPKGALRKDLEKAVEAIKKGKPWAAAMDSLKETDKAALSVSADREQISNTLNLLSESHKNAYARVIGSVGPSLQMVAAIFLVLSGGILFGYTMLPMLQVAAQGM